MTTTVRLSDPVQITIETALQRQLRWDRSALHDARLLPFGEARAASLALWRDRIRRDIAALRALPAYRKRQPAGRSSSTIVQKCPLTEARA